MPLSRLFPKISAKSDDALLIIQSNAIATLALAPTGPTSPAPKNLHFIINHSFRFLLRVNIQNFALSLLCNHLQQALNAHAATLGIRSVTISNDSLQVEITDPPRRTQSHPHTAILDYIILDYRFTHRSPDFDDFISTSASESTGLFLPLRQLLDNAVQKLVCVQLARQFPSGFSPWKDKLSSELGLAESASRHINRILANSDDAFQRKVQKQLRRINAVRIREEQEMSIQLGIAEDEESQEARTVEQLDLASLLSFAIGKTFSANIRPKVIKSSNSANQTDRLDLLDELDLSQSAEDATGSQVLDDGQDVLEYEDGSDILEYDDEGDILDNGDLFVLDLEDSPQAHEGFDLDNNERSDDLDLDLDMDLLESAQDIMTYSWIQMDSSPLPTPALTNSQSETDADEDVLDEFCFDGAEVVDEMRGSCDGEALRSVYAYEGDEVLDLDSP